MTLDEAKKIYYIKTEIDSIRAELAGMEEERSLLGGGSCSDMPKEKAVPGPDSIKGCPDKYAELEQMMRNDIMRLQRAREDFNKFLADVTDPEMRSILRLRCVNRMGWGKIGEKLGMDRRTASRKFYAFWDSKK